jgi:murein DD-endopeptidase MepM/ murein hydrolase activator NlpD
MKHALACGILASLLVVTAEASAKPGAGAQAKAAKPQLQVSTLTPKPGDPVLVTVTGVRKKPSGRGGRVPLVFFEVDQGGQGWQAVFAVPVDDPPAKLAVTVAGLSQSLTVRAHTFAEEPVTVEPQYAEPPPDKRKQIDADNAAVMKAVKNALSPMFRGGFRTPGKGRITSHFGSWRIFNGSYRSRHLGYDIGARKGAPVRAIQHGKVVLVHDGFLTGGTVVLTHGAGIASAYFHLTDIKVAVGDAVWPNETLGKVGLTGRTTGPHIHLGIWVPGGFVDPVAFMALKLAPAKNMPAPEPEPPAPAPKAKAAPAPPPKTAPAPKAKAAPAPKAKAAPAAAKAKGG